jgi:hypothetical protein
MIFKGHKNVQERSGFGFVINRTPGAGSVIQDYRFTTQTKSMVVLYSTRTVPHVDTSISAAHIWNFILKRLLAYSIMKII